MNSLHKLDRALTTAFQPFDEIAASLRFRNICLLSNEERIAGQTYSGLYLIEVKNDDHHRDFASWIEAFTAEWQQEQYVKQFVPNVKKKRTIRHTKLGEWIPLYLGKAQNIASRVSGHINLPLGAKTFALKIKARRNMAGMTFRLRTLRIDVDNYDLIVPRIERAMRDRINPVLGKQ